MKAFPFSAKRGAIALATVLGALLVFARPALAQKYPERPVSIVVPASPGGGVDDYTRLLARYLSQELGQSFVVENRPGAGSILATDYVAKAAPDGHTLLLATTSAMSANPYLYKKLPYDPSKDFEPIARMSALPLALVVPASSPYRDVAEFTAAARASQRGFNHGSANSGFRVVLAAMNEAAGIKSTDIPYKSLGNLVTDLMGGLVDYTVLDISSAAPLVDGGKLRALAVFSPERLPILKDVPTLTEAGIKSVDLTSWTGLFAPAGTPAAIVDELSRLALAFADSPEAKNHYARRGNLALPATGPQLRQVIIDDQQQWQRLISLAGIEPQ